MKFFKSLIFITDHLRGLWTCILFTIICLGVFEWGLFRKNILRSYLENKLSTLTLEFQNQTHIQKILKEQINAQTDPEWIELVLKKQLGVARPHETKILFRSIE